jgi:hypothetical protein
MFKFNRNPRQFLRMLEMLGDRDLTATDIVSLNEPLRSALNAAIRAGNVRLEDFAKDLRLSVRGASQLADALVKKGLFHHIDGTRYDVRVSGKTYSHEKPHTTELWAKFDNDKEDTP